MAIASYVNGEELQYSHSVIVIFYDFKFCRIKKFILSNKESYEVIGDEWKFDVFIYWIGCW